MAKRIRWQDHFNPLDLVVFEGTHQSIFSQTNPINSLFILPEYEALLLEPISKFARGNLYKNPQMVTAKIAKEKKRLIKARIKSDYLFKLIPEWVNEKPTAYIYKRLSKRKMFGTTRRDPFKSDRPKATQLHISLQNILCLSTWGLTISELVILGTLGDTTSTLKLIQLNKQFVSAEMVRNRIELAQYHKDKRFFTRLGNAIKKDAPSMHYHKMTIGTAILLLWFIGFKDISITQLYNYMTEKKYIVRSTTESAFRGIVSRLGLRK